MPTDGWMIVIPLGSIYTMEYNLAMRTNSEQLHTTTWTSLTRIHVGWEKHTARDELTDVMWAEGIRLQGVYIA